MITHTIIAKNTTSGTITFPDLGGFYVVASGTETLSDHFKNQYLETSTDLVDGIQSGDIVINDGEKDLTAQQGLFHVKDLSFQKILEYLAGLTVVGLADTPDDYSETKYFRSTASGTEWITLTDLFYDKTGIDTISGTLQTIIDNLNLFNINPTLPTMSGNALHFMRVNEEEDGFTYVDVISSITWSSYPTYDGDVHVLGWHTPINNVPPNAVDDPFSLSSGEILTSPEKALHTHIVYEILTVTGNLPFTLTTSGTVINEANDIYYQGTENTTVTGVGWYQTSKSFIEEPKISIVESLRECTFNFHRSTYWDAGNENFIVRGCRLEWIPDQPNWLMDVHIYHHHSDGSLHLIDEIHFDNNDTYIRADDGCSGKYKRTDYLHHVHGGDSEGIVITMDQRAIGHYYFELKYSLDTTQH